MALNKKQKKKLLILIIICIVILIGLLLFTEKIINKYNADKAREEYEEFRKEYEEETILPRKIYELYNYEGALERDYLYKHMKVFVDYLDYLKSNVNESNMTEYFNDNQKEIREKTGITVQEKFETLIRDIANYDLKANNFKYAEVQAGSSYIESGYFYFNIIFFYGEEPTPITLKVGFSTRAAVDVKVFYEIVK